MKSKSSETPAATAAQPEQPAQPRWTYSTYRAALRLDGKTVALLTPDGRNAFGDAEVQPILDALNRDEASTAIVARRREAVSMNTKRNS